MRASPSPSHMCSECAVVISRACARAISVLTVNVRLGWDGCCGLKPNGPPSCTLRAHAAASGLQQGQSPVSLPYTSLWGGCTSPSM